MVDHSRVPELSSPPSHPNLFQMISVSCNHTHNYWCFGTLHGFHIYSTNPFKKVLSCPILGGVSIVKMYYETNIILFVGRTNHGMYPNNKLIVWDEDKKRVIGEISFRSTLRAVEVSKQYIVSMTDTHLYIHGFESLNIVKTIPMISPTVPMFSIAEHDKNTMFAYPGEAIGVVCLSRVPLHPDVNLLTIHAHTHAIRLMTLSSDGKYIATCSEKGTMIRMFDTTTGEKVNEFRRGTDPVTIHCMSFNADASLLLVSSTKGTIHLFHTELPHLDPQQCPIRNTQFERLGMYYIRSYLPDYFNHKWSGCNLYFPNVSSVSMFDLRRPVVYTVGNDGQFYELHYADPVTSQLRIEKCIKYYADDSDPFSDRSSTIM